MKQNVVLLNDGLHIAMKSTKKYKLEVINLGLKMFERLRNDKSEVTHRLLQEGLEILVPYMDYSRQIRAPIPFFAHLASTTKSNDHSINFADIITNFSETICDRFRKIP